MKHTRKPLAVLLAVLLIASFAVMAFAVSGTDGDLTWTYNETSKTLTISGSGKMLDYPEDDPYNNPTWFEYREVVETVVIEEGVTRIGDWAFWKFTAMKTVTIPKSVKSIGDGAFFQCYVLETVNYDGTEADWYSIDINQSNNNQLLTVKAAKPEAPAESVCAWCGGDHSSGFFQMIIGWFHGILAAIFGARH